MKLDSKKRKYIIVGVALLSVLIIAIVSIYRVTCSPRVKNEKAIKAVITSLLTCPDVELNQLMKLCTTKLGPEPGDIEKPKPEDLERFDNKMKDMFGKYVTNNTLEYIQTSRALGYHVFTEEKRYEMLVEDLEINQDKNDSRNYTFTVHIKYGSPDNEKKQLVVTGRAQCVEVGKITFLKFSDDFFNNEFMNSN